MSARIGRSVGELLLEADTASRGLMFDASGDDAPAMLRAWGEVVQSASDLWHALPALPGDQTGGGQVMDQLVALSRGMHRTQLRRGWPGEGPPDDRLVHVAATFSAAGDLVARHAGAQPGTSTWRSRPGRRGCEGADDACPLRRWPRRRGRGPGARSRAEGDSRGREDPALGNPGHPAWPRSAGPSRGVRAARRRLPRRAAVRLLGR